MIIRGIGSIKGIESIQPLFKFDCLVVFFC